MAHPSPSELAEVQLLTLIADNSPDSQAALEHWRNTFPDSREHLEKLQTGEFEFFVNLRTLAGAPLFTALAQNLSDLQTMLIPAVIRHVDKARGLCSSILAVRQSLRPALAKLIEDLEASPQMQSPPGRQLYESGALQGRSLVTSSSRGSRPPALVAVIDSSKPSKELFPQLVGLLQAYGAPEGWAQVPATGFLVIRATPEGVESWGASTVAELVQVALPEAFAQLINEQAPTLLLTGLHPMLDFMLSEAVQALSQGILADLAYPLPPMTTGAPVDPFSIKLSSEDLAMRVMPILSYGRTSSAEEVTAWPAGHRLAGVKAFLQADGALHVLSTYANGESLGIRLEPRTWTRVSAEEATEISSTVSAGRTLH